MKRILSTVTALSAALSLSVALAAATVFTRDDIVFENGDINGDGIISFTDLRLLKKIIAA